MVPGISGIRAALRIGDGQRLQPARLHHRLRRRRGNKTCVSPATTRAIAGEPRSGVHHLDLRNLAGTRPEGGAERGSRSSAAILPRVVGEVLQRDDADARVRHDDQRRVGPCDRRESLALYASFGFNVGLTEMLRGWR